MLNKLLSLLYKHYFIVLKYIVMVFLKQKCFVYMTCISLCLSACTYYSTTKINCDKLRLTKKGTFFLCSSIMNKFSGFKIKIIPSA